MTFAAFFTILIIAVTVVPLIFINIKWPFIGGGYLSPRPYPPELRKAK
jgi:hypothetical protein